MEALEDRVVPESKLDPLSGGLREALENVDSSYRAVVENAGAALPVLNDPLSQVTPLTGAVDRFGNALQSAIDTALSRLNSGTTGNEAQSILQSELHAALTRVGVLGDTNRTGGSTIDDVIVATPDLVNGSVTIEVRLTDTTRLDEGEFSLGTGLPGVPLEIEGGGRLVVDVEVDYANLKFGLDSGAFFLNTTDKADELTAKVRASLPPGAAMTGVVGFLSINVAPSSAGPTQLAADLTFDVRGAAPTVYVDHPRLTGGADVNLTIQTSLAGMTDTAPSVAADFRLRWGFDGGSPTNELASLGSAPEVGFNNARVSMGTFVSGVIGPIVENIQFALKPIQPVLSVLNYRIPGLSDLMEAGGKGPVSLLTLANAASAIGLLPANVEMLVRLVNVVNDLNNVVKSIALVGGNVWLPVGNFSFNATNGDPRGFGRIYDPGQLINGQTPTLKLFARTLGFGTHVSGLSAGAGGVRTLEDLVNAADERFLGRDSKDRLRPLIDEIRGRLESLDNGFKLEFPVLQDPAGGVFKLLLGQDIDFVTLTGEYHFFADARQNYNLFKVLAVQVVGFIDARVDLDLYFKMGYDSYGLRQALQNPGDPVLELAKGLYIDSTRPLIELSAGARIGVEGKIPLIGFEDPIFGAKLEVSAGVQFSGGLEIPADDPFVFRLNDTNDADGVNKFRIDYNADQLFTTDGSVRAGIKFEVVAHTPIPALEDIVLYSKTIASHTLIDLNADIHKANPFKAPAGEPPRRRPIVTDLNEFPEANDGVFNRVILEEQEVNGQFIYVLKAYNGLNPEPFFSRPWALQGIQYIRVLGGGDDDLFYTGAIGGTVGDPRNLILDGRGGRNVIDVRALSWANEFDFAAGSIKMRNAYTIEYQGIDEIQAFATTGRHTSRIREVPDGMKLTIHGSPTSNLFLLGDGRANRLNGDLELRGGGVDSYDEIRIDDRVNTSRTSYEIDDNRIQRTSIGLILTPSDPGGSFIGGLAWVTDTLEMSLIGMDAVTIFGGGPVRSLLREGEDPITTGHRYKVEATTLQVSFHGGTGDDVYVIGSEEYGLNGPSGNADLQVSITDRGGIDTLVINDRNSAFSDLFAPAEVTYTVTDQTIVRDSTQYHIFGSVAHRLELDYRGIKAEEVHLYGTNHAATYNIRSTARAGGLAHLGYSFFDVYTGQGNDTVVLGSYADDLGGLKAFVDLHDLGGTDRLVFNARSAVVEDDYVSRDNRLLFGHNGFESVTARVRAGNHTIDVRSLNEGVALSILGADKVTLGGGNLANIKGLVSIRTDNGIVSTDGYSGSPTVSLTFDDRFNANPTTYNLGPASFTSQSAAAPQLNVSFGSAVVEFLTLWAGSTGNTITLADTQPFSNTLVTWLYTGAGINTVNVERARSNVSVIGQGGLDWVHLGAADSVQGITGNVSISNPGGTSLVYLNNAADPTWHAVRLDRVDNRNTPFDPADDRLTVRGLTPFGTIGLQGPDVRTLSINGGAGGGTYDVHDTFGVGSGSRTFLTTGSGADQINVIKTSTPLTVNSGGGENTITIGGKYVGNTGDLGNIVGDVTLQGEPGVGTNTVNVVDRAWPANFEYEMDAAGLRRTLTNILGVRITTTINYDAFPMQTLNLYAGHGNNRFAINNTPAVTRGVTVSSGRGVDSLALLGTNGDLTVNLGGGLNQQVDVGDATHAMEALTGTITVTSATPVEARVTNEATTEEQAISLDQFNTTGFSMYRAELRDNKYHFESELRFAAISSLDFRYGRGYQNVGINGTPAGMTLHVHSYPGQQDYFSFGTSLDRALGPVHYYGQEADQDAAYAYDYLNPNPHTYTFRPDPASPADVIYERDGQAPFHMHMVKNILFYASQYGGNTVNIQHVPEGAAHTVVLGPGDRATVGSAAPGLGGTLAGIRGALGFAGGPDVRLTFDDSGNTDLTPKRVTFDATVPTYIGYNRILGLTGAGISWRSGGVASLDILGGAADESYAITGNPVPTAVRIDGGGGTNTLDYTDYDAAYQGLASVYAGEEDATDSHGANDGTAVGGVAYAPGKVGRAFQFDGVTGHVRVPNAPSLESPAITVEAWVNSSVTGRNRYLVAKGADQNIAPSYALYTGENGGLVFCTYDGTTYVESPDAGAGIWDGNWHHVVGTFDGSFLRLYVDGVEVGTGTLSFARIAYNLPTTNDLFLGGYNGNLHPLHPYAGLLDEVSVFGRALTVAEVQARFASGGSGLYGIDGGVIVNLRTGTATGLAGIANIRNVIGSAGDDILVGDAGDDIPVGSRGHVLRGGAGRDILIAGSWASMLFGGDGEDLLIGGTTAIDTDAAALEAVRAEWLRTDVGYDQRLGNTLSRLQASGPVSSNGQQNGLYGEDGADVFFGVMNLDLSDNTDEVFVGI
jgi:hypothetical protein